MDDALGRAPGALLALVVAALLAGACNEVTDGNAGRLTFTPDQCGRPSCSLDDDLAVGGSILVAVDEREGHGHLAELTLITDAARVLRIQPLRRNAFVSEWRVTALAAGPARLIVIDRQGFEVDDTDVRAASPDRLRVEHLAGAAMGPSSRTGFDEVWTVDAGQRIDLRVEPFRGQRGLMGRIAYHVDLDERLAAGLAPRSSIEHGELAFRVPAGEYDATFALPDGTALRLLVVAR